MNAELSIKKNKAGGHELERKVDCAAQPKLK